MSSRYASLLLVVIGLMGCARAQIPSLGFCPEYLAMSDFDMNRFMGKWYEAERYFTFSDVVSRCVVTDYARAPQSGRIYVSNEVTNRLTGVKRVINGNLQLVGKGDEGKLNVKYATTPIPSETTLTVLETDYDDFAIVWSCSGFGPVHAQNAWLMTRDRLPSGNVLQKAYTSLDKFKINRTFFVKTDQEGCAIVASDINAAHGITPASTVPEVSGSDQRTDEDLRSAPAPDPVPAPAPSNFESGLRREPVETPVVNVEELVEPVETKPVPVAEHILKNVPEVIKPVDIEEAKTEQKVETAEVSHDDSKVTEVEQPEVKAEQKTEIKLEDSLRNQVPVVEETKKEDHIDNLVKS